MPTVLTLNGFQVRIRTNDHTPAHVHVVKSGGEARIDLGLHGQSPRLIWVSKGMSDRDAATAFNIVVENNEQLITDWRKVHE